MLRFAPALDQIEHGLGLHQVHLPVQDRPAGELTGLRQASARGDARVQDHPGHKPAAMARDFDHVLACVTLRPREGGYKRPVQEVSALPFR